MSELRIAAEIAGLTGGDGVDLVFDKSYNEASFVDTSRVVRSDGRWAVLGVGPGRTSHLAETESPVTGVRAGPNP